MADNGTAGGRGRNGGGEVSPHGGFHFSHVFTIMLVVLVFLAMVSHSRDDFAVLEGGSAAPLKNWIGLLGAHFARMSLYLFGVASYPVLLFLSVCFLRPLLAYPLNRKGYIGSLIAIVLGTTILFAMWPENFAGLTEYLGIGQASTPYSALSGGVIGQKLAAPASSVSCGLITGFIGKLGTLVVALVFLLSGLLSIWFSDWQPVVNTYSEEKRRKIEEEISIDKIRAQRQQEIEEKLREMKKKAEEEAKQKEADKLKEKEKDKPEPEKAKEQPPEPEPPVKEKPAPEKQKEKESIVINKPPQKRRIEYEGMKYVLPQLSLLEKGKEIEQEGADIIAASKMAIQKVLDSFAVAGKVGDAISGPRVTRYEITLEPGVKVEKVTGIERNLTMSLQAESIRILAPIPGKNAVGIEVPNTTTSFIAMRSIMESSAWTNSHAEIPIVLGKDISGKSIVTDLAKAPHLLIAGATGSGKSVCLNVLIMSLLYKFSPTQLRMILVDPKQVEFKLYTSLPHLITPVVTSAKTVPITLRWAINEMERRYGIFTKTNSKKLADFNSRPKSPTPILDDDGQEIEDTLPLLVIIIDELADIMMTEAKGDVETSIARIAQKGRAAGIHIVVATQTPRKEIITGVIKANLVSRIAFQVRSIVDSRVILDQKGAETLLGKGDMLFIPPGSANIERIQGAMVSDPEIEKVVKEISKQLAQKFDETVTSAEIVGYERGEEEDLPLGGEEDGDGAGGSFPQYYQPGDDDIMKRAIDVILTDRKASTSYLQRRLGIGYNKSANIMETLEKRGIVGPPLGASAKRDILVGSGAAAAAAPVTEDDSGEDDENP